MRGCPEEFISGRPAFAGMRSDGLWLITFRNMHFEIMAITTKIRQDYRAGAPAADQLLKQGVALPADLTR